MPSAGHTQGHVVSAAHVLQGHVVSAAHVQQEGHVDPVVGNGQVGAFVTSNYTNVVTSAGGGVTASAGGYDPLSITLTEIIYHGNYHYSASTWASTWAFQIFLRLSTG